MNPTRDDDALNWAGDDDPTLASGGADRVAPEPTGLPEGWTIPHQGVSAVHPADTVPPDDSVHPAAIDTADASTADASTADADTSDAGDPALSSVALVGMGIVAGMYLLYSVGWFIGVARLEQTIGDPVAEFMFTLGAWLAVAAPIVWFGVTYWLTTSRPRARLAWLLTGVVVLVPFPFIIGAGAGS
jgi:hypothetical protein